MNFWLYPSYPYEKLCCNFKKKYDLNIKVAQKSYFSEIIFVQILILNEES